MGKTLYLECNSGISGDMTVGALLDLGADQEKLLKVLNSLPVQGAEIRISRANKSGLDCCDFDVVLDHEHENHDHDMAYLHGDGAETHTHEHHDHEHDHEHHHHDHEHEHDHEHDHDHEHHHHDHEHDYDHEHHHEHHHHEHHHHEHDHDHEHHHDHHHHDHEHDHEHHHHAHDHHHDHEHHHSHEHNLNHVHDSAHPHEHRGLREVQEIIGGADMTERARTIALRIFDILADAEAKAHGTDKFNVHFHEVGAVDSIMDIVAVAVCLDDLDITETIVPYLCEGSGTIRCQHGIIPVPVPATSNIASAHGLTLQMTGIQGELVTPTGAAIVAAIRTSEKLPGSFRIDRIGMGAGKRQYERPSVVRAMLITDTKAKHDVIAKLECNIDDCSGEALGYCMNKLFEAGARDVHYTPVFMKKNRPAWQLNVICSNDDVQRMEEIIFAETTTIGIRRMEMERTVLERQQIKVQTAIGEAIVKVCSMGELKKFYPEYDSVAALAEASGKPFGECYALVQAACR